MAPVKREDFEKDKWDTTELAEYAADERYFLYPRQHRELLHPTGVFHHRGGYFLFRNINMGAQYISGPEEYEPERLLDEAFENGLDNLFLVRDDLPPQDEMDLGMDLDSFDKDPTFDDIYYDQLREYKRNSVALALIGNDNEDSIRQTLMGLRDGFVKFPDYHFTIYSIDNGSRDNTTEEILRSAKELNLGIKHYRNPRMEDPSKVLRMLYKTILDYRISDATDIGKEDYFNFIIRTDFNKGDNAERIIESFSQFLEGTHANEQRFNWARTKGKPTNLIYDIDYLHIMFENISFDHHLRRIPQNPDRLLRVNRKGPAPIVDTQCEAGLELLVSWEDC